MSPDVRTVLEAAAAAPRRPFDPAGVLDRSRTIGRRRAALASLAVLPVLAAVAAVALRPPPERNVVTAPPAGEVGFAKLADGTRVYVVTHADGSVSALDTVGTHRPVAVDRQVGWCATSRWFEDPRHGSKYDEYGVYAYGPAASDLAYYRLTHEGGNRYRVGEKVVRTGRGGPAVPAAGPVCTGDGVHPDPPLVFWDAPGGGRDRTYDMGDVPDRRYARVEAALLVDAWGQTRVCDRDRTDCLPFRSNERGMPRDAERRYEGTYVVRREGGEIAEIVAAGRQERSSSRQRVYRVREIDARGMVHVRPGELLTGDFAAEAARDAGVEAPHGMLLRLPMGGYHYGSTVHPSDQFRLHGRVVGGTEWVAYLRANPGTLFSTEGAGPVSDLRHLQALEIDPRLVAVVDPSVTVVYPSPAPEPGRGS